MCKFSNAVWSCALQMTITEDEGKNEKRRQNIRSMQQARFALMIAEGKKKIKQKEKIKLKLSKKMDDWFPDRKIGSRDNNVKPDFGDSPSYHRCRSICPLMLTTSTLETYFFLFFFYLRCFLAGHRRQMARIFV